jgi:hypothetical protein
MGKYNLGINWSKKQYFLHACFADDLQEYYKEYIAQKFNRKQEFNELPNGVLIHKDWCPSRICRHSKQTIESIDDLDVFVGYWTPHCWYPVKKEFRKIGMDLEAYECQLIDCSCNDCVFLDRANILCTKFNKPTFILPNHCHPQNQDCFKHRKASK